MQERGGRRQRILQKDRIQGRIPLAAYAEKSLNTALGREQEKTGRENK